MRAELRDSLANLYPDSVVSKQPRRQMTVDVARGAAAAVHVLLNVYPGTDGPWSSLRLESHREGFEDYELLRRLRDQDPQAAARILRKAVRGFDKYVKDVSRFRGARKALLEALDR